MMKSFYDIIIVGAGVSGLILADEITRRTKKSVLVIEKKKKLTFDKNLCFWNIPSNLLTKYADDNWKDICVVIEDKKTILKSSKIKYLRIKSNSFYNFFLKRLKNRKNFHIIMDQYIKNEKISEKLITLYSNKNSYKCFLLFDSRIKNNFQGSEKQLYQHFYGAELSFENKILNDKEITLMDIQDKSKSFNFFYLLPFNKKRMLVESTYFSSKIESINTYRLDLDTYLSKNYFGQKYKIYYTEKGVIPMFKIDQPVINNYFKIGLAGNWVRQSTGYSLQNSFKYSKQIVDCIINEKPIKINEDRIIGFLDKIFCNFIKSHPEKAKEFFKMFFTKNKLETIVSFLTGTAGFFETIRIILSLPKINLLKSITIIK